MRKHSQKSNGAMRTPNTAPDIALEVPPFLRQQDAGGSSPPLSTTAISKRWLGQSRNGQKPILPNKLSKKPVIQEWARCQPAFRQALGWDRGGACRARTSRGGNPHGKNHAPCMISGISTRKSVLDGKISAPRIPNRLIVPENGHMRRGSCHHYLEKHT